MSGARRHVAALAATLVLACASLAAAQPAQDSAPGADSLRAAPDSLRTARAPAAADTANALQRFLRQLSDSTARVYGVAAAPLDTAGLDSALAAGLLGEAPRATRRGRPVELSPWFQFARVDGPVMGGVAAIGRRAKFGRAAATLGWASGSDLLLGGGQYEKRWARPRDEESWTFTATAGRSTDVLDLDRHRQLFSTMSAFVLGNDRHHYLRRDGVRAALVRRGLKLRWQLAWRQQLESPRVTTATWNLTHSPIEIVENFPATFGRNSEFQLGGSLRPLRWPLWIEADSRLGAGADFDYRRLRANAAADVPLARWVTLLPQASWGVLDGDVTPQNAFWLGGPSSMRSLPSYAATGDHLAFGRLELVIARDLVAPLNLPRTSALNLQPTVFVASGAVWGRDPFGGPGTPAAGRPRKDEWHHELGIGFYYRPGVPEPEGFFRILYAHPLGANDDGARVSVSYSLALDQLRFRGE